MNWIFRQLLDYETFTYTYLLADPETKDACLIDTVRERWERDLNLIQNLGVNLKYLLETHVHADHVTGCAKLKEHLKDVKVVMGVGTGVKEADILLKDGEALSLGNQSFKAFATPGHTDGCTSYYFGDRVFTGDSLMIRKCGRTDFQQGSAAGLYQSIHLKLYSLPDETLVFPAHDYNGFMCSSIGEEKKWNTRCATNITLNEFTHIMDNLNLSPPRHIEVAVPANLKLGRVD